MKPLIIYHDNCADGFGAAFAAWLKFGEEAEYLPLRYGKEFPAGADYEFWDVYILDFSFPKIQMQEFFDFCNKVVWLDHHKTAFETWGATADTIITGQDLDVPMRHSIILDNNKSGAVIAWEYFHPGMDVPMLIQHIDDYDRWQFKLPMTKAFNKALWSYTPWSFEQWHKLFGQISKSATRWTLEDMYEQGEAILRAHDQNVQAVVNGSARPCLLQCKTEGMNFLTDYRGLAANCPPHLASDAGHELATQFGTYGLLWHINKEGKCLCSLRSNGDYDVSAIAKAFGGGGHKNAAGFEVSIQALLEWIK